MERIFSKFIKLFELKKDRFTIREGASQIHEILNLFEFPSNLENLKLHFPTPIADKTSNLNKFYEKLQSCTKLKAFSLTLGD